MNLFDINANSEARAAAFVEWLFDDPIDPMYLDYLDGLYDAGVKMTKAGKYLREDFGMADWMARVYVLEWISITNYDFENEG